MRRRAIFGALLLIAVGVALGATVFRTDIAQATGLAQSVTIDNTPAQAVPVRDQNLDVNGNIKVHEQGTVSVRSGDQEVSATGSGFSNLGGVCGGDVYTVPSGKQLVVKYISASGHGATSASSVTGFIRAELNGDPIAIFLPVVFQKQGFDNFTASETVNYVVPPGTDITFLAEFEGPQCSARFNIGGVLQAVS